MGYSVTSVVNERETVYSAKSCLLTFRDLEGHIEH